MASFLPKSDADLLAWSANFSSLLSSNFASYGLTEPQASDFHDTQLDFAGAYTTAYNPTTRTAPTIAAKDAAKATLEAMARSLVKIIQLHPGLTDEQRRALKITVPKNRSSIPAPTERPMMSLVSVVGRTVTVKIYDPTSATKRNKPADAAAAWVYSYVGTSYPSDPTAWDFQGAANKNQFDFTVSDSVAAGAQIWICAAWINRKNQSGPVSLPITTNIQGGGESQQQGMKIAA